MTYTDFRLKIRNFFKRNKKKIIIGIIILIVVIIINYYLGTIKEEPKPKTTYEPHVSVMDEGSSVPKKYRTPIEELIDNFITYCNDKEYDKAYDLLSSSCKEFYYTDIELFKEYVEQRFPQKKLYAIQDYSNINGMYIYQVKLFNDILASGLTNEEYKYYDEKFAIKEENGTLKMSINGFIEKKDIKNVMEDNYLKIDIKDKIVRYNSETYRVKITNRSEYVAVLADYNVNYDEIVLNLGQEYRKRAGYEGNIVVLSPGESKEYEFEFTKFYDDGDTAKDLVFNAIRIFENYETYAQFLNGEDKDLENVITKYSIKMKVD